MIIKHFICIFSLLISISCDEVITNNCTDVDCAGVCGGNAIEDCAGVCNGDAIEDCTGVCNGDAIEDWTGECNGDTIEDCTGECDGNAIVDECGECGGAGPEENYDCEGNCIVNIDCNEECGGDAVLDECGECGGDGIYEGVCDCNGNVVDCLGECGGDAVVDECGECGGNGIIEGACDCDENIEDCFGECGGDAILNLSSDWNVQIIASTLKEFTTDQFITDQFNYFGVYYSSLDNYDSMDLFDPGPEDLNSWIQAYFYHPEWGHPLGDSFTQEYKSNEFCGDESKEWDLTLLSNNNGLLELEFIFNNVPGNVEIQIFEDEEGIIINNNSIIESTIEPGILKEFMIKVSVN